MKFVKLIDGKIGIFVQLPNGEYAIDIASNLGFFFHEPLSYSILNGALKEGLDWSILVKHWAYLRAPMEKLQKIALAGPDHSLVLQCLTEAPRTASAINPIIAIEITDAETFEEQDPTRRRTMERQSMPPPASEPPRDWTATKTAQVIDFPSNTRDSSRK
jgi:hypothetical protein